MGIKMRRLCVSAAVMTAAWIGPASAQTLYTGVQPPAAGAVDAGASGGVLGTSGGVPGSSGGVLGSSGRLQVAQTPQASQGRLAVTGTDVMSLVTVGCGAIALGLFLKRRAHA